MMMQTWLCTDAKDVDSLQWHSQPLPAPASDEVLVRIAAASINFPDLLMIQGRYQVKPPLPFVPGAEFAGVVEHVGSGVTQLKPGDAVAAFVGTGGFASHACVKASQLLPLPPGFALDEAAAFLCTYATSHHALMDRAALQAGETVLVLGAGGGVGTASIQIAKAAGARVIAAAGSPEKAQRCLALGADAALSYGSDDFRALLASLTEGRGPDVIVDPVGGPIAEQAFRSIAWRGRHLVIGFAQGEIPRFPLNLCLLKGAALVGVFWGEFAKREPAANVLMLKDLLRLHAQGLIRPVIDSRWPLSQLPAAFARMSQREVLGKLLVLPEPAAS